MTIDNMLENPEELKDLILGYEPAIWTRLALCIKLLPNARRGFTGNQRAIIKYLSEIEQSLIDCAVHKEEKAR